MPEKHSLGSSYIQFSSHQNWLLLCLNDDFKDVTLIYTCGILNTSALPSGQDAVMEPKG